MQEVPKRRGWSGITLKWHRSQLHKKDPSRKKLINILISENIAEIFGDIFPPLFRIQNAIIKVNKQYKWILIEADKLQKKKKKTHRCIKDCP